MNTYIRRCSVLAMIGMLFVCAPVASASLIIFDDAVQAPFSSFWNNQLVANTDFPAHSGNFSIRRETGTSINGVIFENSAGFSLNSLNGNTTLEFWVNSPYTNSSLVEVVLRVQGSSPSVFRSMGTRSQGVTWIVDDVPSSGVVMLNGDSNVWQRVTFDLTQTYWRWDGSQDVAATLDPNEVFDRFEIRGNSANWAPYLDSVSLIPEPGTLFLVLAGGFLMFAARFRYHLSKHTS